MVSNPAGFWIRFIANFVDGLIMLITTGVLSYLFYQTFMEPEEITFLDFIEFFYYLLLPILWTGYTLGKNMFGIRIARMDGKKVNVGTMLLRLLVSGIVFMVTLGVGVIISAFMVGLREDKRGIHDFIAGTYVTYDKPEAAAVES